MSRSAFDRLAGKIARTYRRKGYAPKRARYIGRAAAGEVATRKHKRARGERRT